MENSKEEDRLFICRIRKTLQKYNLPSPEEILENPPKKQQWKNAMKKAINSFWYDKWTNENNRNLISAFCMSYFRFFTLVVFLLDFVEFLDILM
jgi:hypothetical protein